MQTPRKTARPQPRVTLVKPPLTTSPGTPVLKRVTIATTPLPRAISTNVPRNSASSSPTSGGLSGVVVAILRRPPGPSGRSLSLYGARAVIGRGGVAGRGAAGGDSA